MSRTFNVNKLRNIEPERCWVGDAHKIVYKTCEEAETAARIAEHDHNIPGGLSVYKCEYGDHFHLSSK
ncbi:hypothetical protein IJ380_01685 [Candidatus Saccharibacteria bacterium]|nr:hypothetical protein [Candidatus Saccharibacteria bacterium]